MKMMLNQGYIKSAQITIVTEDYDGTNEKTWIVRLEGNSGSTASVSAEPRDPFPISYMDHVIVPLYEAEVDVTLELTNVVVREQQLS